MTEQSPRTLESFQENLKRPSFQRVLSPFTPRSLSIDPVVVERAAGELDDFRSRDDVHLEPSIEE